jgi:tight adherence protein C
MNIAGPILPAAISAAMAIAAFALLCGRTLATHCVRRSVALPLPLPIRIFLPPALLLVPLVSMLMPLRAEQSLVRTLDSLGLYPQVNATTWLALRAAHGLAAAVAMLLIAGPASWALVLLAATAGFMVGSLWLRRARVERERLVVRELPAYLDLLTVCVEAGATLTAGVRLIVAQAPDSPLRGYFDRVLREVRGGRPRAQAFSHVAELHGVDSLITLAQALAHAEAAGMSLGQILRAQSEQRTAERFARAERLAMQAPVKMLGPLILCIFPCTFIVLAVPITVRMLEVFHS